MSTSTSTTAIAIASSFVETRGDMSVLNDTSISWVKASKAVAGYNGGRPQYELQISTADVNQANAWKTVMPNIRVNEEGITTFTLKRAAFNGRPSVVHADGTLFTEAERNAIGNMSTADVRISAKTHPTSGTAYVQLEAIRVTELIKFVAQPQVDNNFDF